MKIDNLTISQLHAHYRQQDFTPGELIETLLQRAAEYADYNSWITLLSYAEIQPYLACLQGKSPDELPLYGIPFAVKDNIDLKGIATTAACEAFRYVPDESAYVVQLLLDAGAIPLGKTNLDQFATGLVGVRSPYGATKNAFNSDYISGGSSSGSAVVVAQGIVSFALGTDTAGSGRIPAGFNNILGLKPTRGLLSTRGVVPACKTLDCVSIFATTTNDLQQLLQLTASYDTQDPYSRLNTESSQTSVRTDAAFTFAVPNSEQLEFFGNEDYRQQFQQAIAQLEQLGGKKLEIDFSAFLDAAKLLYAGPWVSERYLACESVLAKDPSALLDVTRSIIEPGKDFLATDAYRAQYQLQTYKQKTDALLSQFEFLLTPTAGTIYTIAEVQNDPIKLNSNLGYYTNYMNLLDYASIAVPTGFTSAGLPFGVTLVSTAFSDQRLLGFAHRLQQALKLTLGATAAECPEQTLATQHKGKTMKLVVCGAHLSGLPLNGQLLERDAVLVKQCQSAASYKLYALPGGPPERPGMVRVEKEGSAIEVEVWEMPTEHFGSFLACIPHPLGLGKIELDDGSWETGFICEAYMVTSAKDITELGGWRNYLSS